MIPKHREMDATVEQIFQAIITKEHLKSTLLILCGDHGMNDAGNHGGSALGETSPALVFISPILKAISSGTSSPSEEPAKEFHYYNVVEQSDIAPTLAGLLGFPVPLNNLGVFIPEFLQFWPESSFAPKHSLKLKHELTQIKLSECSLFCETQNKCFVLFKPRFATLPLTRHQPQLAVRSLLPMHKSYTAAGWLLKPS